MIDLADRRARRGRWSSRAGAPDADRRRVVERRLAEHGLLAGRGGVRALRPGEAAPEHDLVDRLRLALPGLGPVFASFALYLSTRPDLFAPRGCLELGTIPDWGEPLPPDELHEALRRELGAPIEVFLRELDDEPAECGHLFQVHHGRLASGEPVTIRLRRPELDGCLETDLELLSSLSLPLSVEEGVPAAAEDVVADFRRDLRHRIDLEREAGALESLAADVPVRQLARVPPVHRRMTTPALLVHGRLPEGGPAETPRDAALRLALLWLHLLFEGPGFPAEIGPSSVYPTADGGFALAGGGIVRPRPATRVHLRDYLAAAAARDPAEALTHLLPEMIPGEHALGEDRLRLRARQVVPFRDGSWSAGGDELAEHLFLQWRVAREHGYRPRAELVAFYRGLFGVARRGRGGSEDVLGTAIEELRRREEMEELRSLLSPADVGRGLEPHARLLMELPQKLDRALSQVASGETVIRVEMSEPPETDRRRDGMTAVLALALALVAVALAVPRLAALEAAGGWVERVGALLVLGLGGLLLRGIHRGS